jgi:hypothetical protein
MLAPARAGIARARTPSRVMSIDPDAGAEAGPLARPGMCARCSIVVSLFKAQGDGGRVAHPLADGIRRPKRAVAGSRRPQEDGRDALNIAKTGRDASWCASTHHGNTTPTTVTGAPCALGFFDAVQAAGSNAADGCCWQRGHHLRRFRRRVTISPGAPGRNVANLNRACRTANCVAQGRVGAGRMIGERAARIRLHIAAGRKRPLSFPVGRPCGRLLQGRDGKQRTDLTPASSDIRRSRRGGSTAGFED